MGDHGGMKVRQVDERTSSWEDADPVFRVYLHGASDNADQASWTDTYDVTGADVLQVIDWAQRQAGEQLIYAVALVGQYDDSSGVTRQGLTWLVGMDGCSTPLDNAERDAKSRMLTRRHHPVTVPQADQAPATVLSPYTDRADGPRCQPDHSWTSGSRPPTVG